ncbi:MAG: uracil-DNA glycosylase [Planctomycetota bacterium]
MSDLAEELSRLTYALRRTARRRGALGLRRTAALPPPPVREARATEAFDRETIRPQPPPPPKREAKQAPAPSPPATAQPSPAEIAARVGSLEELRTCVASCTACALSETRTQTVFADGLGTRRILFVGEAPGADEDRTGTPFVGRAGALVTDIITKGMRLSREDVYIANVLKCRPPGNRDPEPSEKALCTGWLDRQIELVDPLVIIPLGRHAACHVLGVEAPLGRLRGRVHDRDGRKVVPTYHPAYLLRSPGEKRKTWEDIQLAMREAGLS